MGNCFRLTFPIWFACVSLFVVAVPCGAGKIQERQATSAIRVIMDDNYPPYVFKDSAGHLRGILIDQWRLWEKKTGIRAEITAMDWADAQRRMQEGGFDVIDTIFRSEKREQLYDFSKPYARLDVPLFFRSDISGIKDIGDLKGFAVAVKAGGNVIDVLRSHGIQNLVEFKSYEAIVAAARDHKVNVFTVERPPAYYFLYKFGIQEKYRETQPLYTGEFHRAVLKGNRAILETVETGFAKITSEEYREIENRWYGTPILSKGQMRHLTIGIVVSIGLLLALVLWLSILKRTVAQRTKSLQEEIERRIEKESLLREREDDFRRFIAQAPIPIAINNREGCVEPLNNQFVKTFGYTSVDIPTTDAWWPLAYPDEKYRKQCIERWQQAMDRARREGVDVDPEEYRVTCKDGTVRIVEIHGSSIGRWDFNIFSDMTEHYQMQDELLKNQKLESLGILAGGIAHDFNNILMGILGNISLARQFLENTHKASPLLSEAEKASQRASALAHRLLTFAKGSKPVKKPASARHLVEEALSFILSGSKITASVALPDNLHPVEVDEGQISQTFNNIIINAAQAMPGGGKLTVTAENTAIAATNAMGLAAGNYVRVRFSDTGCGIPEENLKRIFDPYFTTKSGGTGLGLASAFSIISKHGGHIGVSSVLGKGTTFELLLPACHGDVAAPAAEPSFVPAMHVKSGKSVLVVDDEAMIRDITSMILQEMGYRVRTSHTGEEGIILYRSAMEAGEPFCAVILDLTIPGGMSGRETAGQILLMDEKAVLIASSGYSNDPVMAEYSTFGFSAALAKPYKVVDLARVLQAVAGTR